jgi:MFS family permease
MANDGDRDRQQPAAGDGGQPETAMQDSGSQVTGATSDAGRQTAPKKKKPFYGWWIVAGGFLLMATCYTVFVNCIPLFQSHVVADMGITVGQFNTGVSLCTVVAVFASLVIGKLIDIWDVRILGTFTVVVCFFVLLGMSAMDAYWQLLLLCVLAGMVVVAGTRLLASVVIANWFTAKRGLAVSIALSGSGAGGVILSPVVSALITSVGWRMAFVVLAFICLVLGLPLIVAFFRNKPADKGLEPYGAGEGEEAKADRSPDRPVTVAIGWKVLRRSAAFWVLIVGFTAMGVVNGAVITNSVSNMTSVGDVVTGGHDVIWAGNVWSFYLACVIVWKITLGAIYDRFGMRTGTVLGTLTCAVACVFLMFPTTDWGPILACFTFAFGTCMGTVAPPIMAVKEFGKKDLGTVTGIITAFEMFGSAVGAVVFGMLFDVYLTFAPAWIMSLVASLIMGAALLVSIRMAKGLVQRQTAAGAETIEA